MSEIVVEGMKTTSVKTISNPAVIPSVPSPASVPAPGVTKTYLPSTIPSKIIISPTAVKAVVESPAIIKSPAVIEPPRTSKTSVVVYIYNRTIIVLCAPGTILIGRIAIIRRSIIILLVSTRIAVDICKDGSIFWNVIILGGFLCIKILVLIRTLIILLLRSIIYNRRRSVSNSFRSNRSVISINSVRIISSLLKRSTRNQKEYGSKKYNYLTCSQTTGYLISHISAILWFTLQI